MYKIIKPLIFSCKTPTHVGSGADLGHVDLPIQRESHTGFPKFEASSLKGAIRDRLERVYANDNNKLINLQLAFGYDANGLPDEVKKKFDKPSDGKKIETDANAQDAEKEVFFTKEFAGALAFSDARLLFFPVKSVRGVFALITCPFVLGRFTEELAWAKEKGAVGEQAKRIEHIETEIKKLKQIELAGQCLIEENSMLKLDNNNIVLEEYCFKISSDSKDFCLLNFISAFKELFSIKLKSNIVILSDNDFKDFVELFTEQITRVKIDNETGTVKNGQLFSEEYLPEESILYAMSFASPIFQAKSKEGYINNETSVYHFLTQGLNDAKWTLQIGANVTLGKGIIGINKMCSSKQ